MSLLSTTSNAWRVPHTRTEQGCDGRRCASTYLTPPVRVTRTQKCCSKGSCQEPYEWEIENAQLADTMKAISRADEFLDRNYRFVILL